MHFPTELHTCGRIVEKGTTDTTGPRADAIWSRTVEHLREELPAGTFNMWFAEVRADAVNEHTIELLAPSEYVRAWLARNYLDLITRLVAQANGKPLDVAVTVVPSAPAEARIADEPPAPIAERRPVASTSFPTRYTFDNFVLGASNRFAHAAAMAVAEAPPSKAYNPLFIYGGVGLGKTHLLYAIANHMTMLTPALRTKYVTSEAFVTEFIKAVREGQGYLFQRRYRDVDVLLVDDIRFLWGLIVDIQPPNLETRIAILQQKALRDQIEIPDSVLHFIAEKFDANIRELEGALLRVVAFASLSRQAVDLALAERALEDLLPQGNQEVPAETIMAETASYFSLRREDLVSKSRSRPLTTARHIAMYLLRELTGLSLIKIGELFDRDHSTALHGIKRIENLMPNRDTVYRQVQGLTKKINDRARGTT